MYTASFQLQKLVQDGPLKGKGGTEIVYDELENIVVAGNVPRRWPNDVELEIWKGSRTCNQAYVDVGPSLGKFQKKKKKNAKNPKFCKNCKVTFLKKAMTFWTGFLRPREQNSGRGPGI